MGIDSVEQRKAQARERARQWRLANKERVAANAAAYREANRALLAEKQRAYYLEERDRLIEYSRMYQRRSESAKRAKASWRTKNRHVVNAWTAKRRAGVRARTASWDAELTELACIEAHHLVQLRNERSGTKWHVDHVVPLHGELVSGLHVWNNLQVIPASLNVRKRNKFDVR